MCMNCQVRGRLMLRRNCFGVVGPNRDSSGRQDAVRTFLSPASGDCRRQSPPSCGMPLQGETRACALSRRRRGSRLNPLSRTSHFPKAPALVNWTLAFRALLCPRKGLSPPDSCIPTDCQHTFFRFPKNIARKARNDDRKQGEAEGQGHVAREQTAHGSRPRRF